jgi:hypothetical protein
VSPPKGHCFTITTFPEIPDTEVCKKTNLRWQFQDLDRHTGSLTWYVRTGLGDFGTPIQWKTRYSIAKIIPAGFEFNEANSTPLFIKSCDAIAADPSSFVSRRIKLSFLNGQTWLIRFPEKDELLPAYVPPPPPLTLEQRAELEKERQKNEAKAKESGQAETAPKVEPTATAKAKSETPPEGWTISTRRAFVMDVSNVVSETSTAPNTKGKCRYQYDGVRGDFDTGRIECHYGDNFLYFYAPLPCLKYLKPK